MLKKILVLSLTLMMCLSLFAIPVSALEATPAASTVLVNGKNVAFGAYLINGDNYFRLSDLAYTLNGTPKQFAVGWDGANKAITLTSGQAYAAVGGEMAGKGTGTKTPTPTTSKIIKDGKEVQFTAYLIDGNNYFKLRDIGAAFDFGVDWDRVKNTIVIDTSKGYTPEGGATTPGGGVDAKLIGRWETTINRNATDSYTYAYYFREDGTFIFSVFTRGIAGVTGSRNGNYSVSNGWITFTNVVARDVNGNIVDWKETVRAEYKFEAVNDPNYKHGEYLIIVPFDFPGLDELPLDAGLGWARWSKMDLDGARTPTPEPTTPSGGIDAKLIDEWQHWDLSNGYTYNYIFYSDGSFKFTSAGSRTAHTEGKYRTSNGKVYFAKVYDIDAIGRRVNMEGEYVFEYVIGNDDRGEYLMIEHFSSFIGFNRTLSDASRFERL